MEPYIARAFASLTTGIYVLTMIEEGRTHGMSSSWVTQISGEPPLFAAAVDKGHFSHGIIERSGIVGLNIVGRRGRELEDYFNSSQARRPDNLEPLEHEPSPVLGVPWLKLAMLSIEARVEQHVGTGDHTVFVLSPVGARIGLADEPLTSLDLNYVYVGGKELIPRRREEKE
jgi:flavin reductase (DIM6/NTAB) family NADH-FMN oxidoreductase RutF